ncbi:hypothetical protein BDP81DRAFT_128659 [Colletotrichum phormii]|uniref:Uncharacterized protein n=1 Tax=Colletotrichum phormii TaxID=359342 RepID=A0AAJ0A2B3_9PEZI|nr:uncharacterized protein BDP81DRAFT_128659 [Colletotrichum phormii]KAK1641159.1 hypothetical protein BDP81DRAFT_128659 [Colletotrichum phormii]
MNGLLGAASSIFDTRLHNGRRPNQAPKFALPHLFLPFPPVCLFPSTHHRLLNRVPRPQVFLKGLVSASTAYPRYPYAVDLTIQCSPCVQQPSPTQALAGASSKFSQLPLEIRKEHGCLYLPGLLRSRLSRGLSPSLFFFCAVLGCLRNLFLLLRVGVHGKISFSFGISYLCLPHPASLPIGPCLFFVFVINLPLTCSLTARLTLTRPKFHH